MTETTSPTTHDPPPTPVRPGAAAWLQLVLAEARMVVRDTAGLIIPIGLPLLILVMNGLGAADEPLGDTGLTAFDAYVVPVTLVIVVALIGVVNMPSFLATYRKTGVLRRLAVTPARPVMVLVAQVVTSVLQTVVGVALALAVAAVAFDLAPPAAPLAATGVVVLAAAAMYALGVLVAAVSPTANASVAIGMLIFFGMGAAGGMFAPPDALPDALARAGELAPFGAAVQALQAAWLGGTVEVAHLVSLGAVAVGASVLGAVLFRWE